MARVDWSETQGFALQPGVYLARVAEAQEKVSKKGDAYFDLDLVASEWGDAPICNDILMIEGKGRGIGTGKLDALGIERGKPEVLSMDLVGRSVYVAVDTEVSEYNGKVYNRLKVDIKQGASFGYWPIATPPPFDVIRRPEQPMVSPPPKTAGAVSSDSDIPF